jgi:hypothetical protein
MVRLGRRAIRIRAAPASSNRLGRDVPFGSGDWPFGDIMIIAATPSS